MTGQESLDYLYGLQKFGIKLGLENIRTFLSRLDHPENRFKSVLVAGTNGKGSIASALAGILRDSGFRTGLYTSPHLHVFNERIRVNGEMIPDDRIARLVARLRTRTGSIPITFFEFTTALALEFFAEQEVEVAVLEVGLGGRFDATNAIAPVLSVVAPVARDHQQYLGEDLDSIAREKAGIMRGGVPVVSAPQVIEVEEALLDEAKKVGTEISFCGKSFHFDDAGETFDYRGIKETIAGIRPGIPGRHQFANMATALAAAEMLQPAGYDLPAIALRSGVEKMFWPGRLEWLAKRSILLDGAHNGAAANVLARYLEQQDLVNVHWIVGLKADKNSEEVLIPLLPACAALYCVEPPVEEAKPTAELVAIAERHGVRAASFASIEAALDAVQAAAADSEIVLVAGSLFLVAAVREIILQEEGRRCDEQVS
ncbi:MAG: bifunctional folylpolyglutamate synthase/dihydrofolate synthase [Desulfuromonas sp.]|nr:MAG: bifunctional folylpolyglutamate synthase/dihydrofolate synthase [Desulfuromonas sp.]